MLLRSASRSIARATTAARPYSSTAAAMSSWSRLVRFVPKGSSEPAVGSPVDPAVDVGLAVYEGKDVPVSLYSGSSVLSPGSPTGSTASIASLLSPLAASEVGSIRCIGLNYRAHAKEGGLDLPPVPIVFLKPATSLADPFPTQETVVPRHTVKSGTADYESELAVVLGKEAKNLTPAEVVEGGYVLGYTAANDISAREEQFAQSQWSYSKGFDGACPIGPVLVSAKEVGDPSKLKMTGKRNGKVVQETGIDDLIFSVAELVSFLSQGTTLPAGTLILTGTPSGVGIFRKPRACFEDGDSFEVTISGGVGTLVSKIKFEK